MTASTTCRSCGAAIRWATTTRGHNIPVDAAPDPAGTLVYVRPGVVAVVTADALPLEDRYTTHFVTCPDAASWRRPR